MPYSRRLFSTFGYLLIWAMIGLAQVSSQVAAQTSAIDSEIGESVPAKEVAVSPAARDTQIADRLTRILDASEWFTEPNASVREGIVFLDGTTETEERREWARQLALHTEDVVAVVNRIEVEPTISWDLTPTWRELERLAERAQWFAPLTVVSVIILFVTWLVSRGVAGLARHAPLLHRFLCYLSDALGHVCIKGISGLDE